MSIPVLVALLLTPTAPGATSAAGFSDTVLPLLVSEGGAPAAALLAQDRHDTRRAWRSADAGRGIARADHFRAGSVTQTFMATVVLQLAAEHRLSLSDTVEQHLPGLLPRLRAGTRHSGEESGRVTPARPSRSPQWPPPSQPPTTPRVDGTRVTLDTRTGPRLETALLAAEFCPRTWWNDRAGNGDAAPGHSLE
ncbi:serine hydrolase [Streptomyces sp. NPDC048202]|uniref:serine hydrolase n=1 Tax=Streptomyces sp. NPDC048202 TaxID=3365514 RepID=UPI003721D067